MNRYSVAPVYVPLWIEKAVEELRPRPRLPASQWAEKNRVLPPGNAIPGPWRNRVTPYLTEIMDAVTDGDAERIIFVKPPRSSSPLPSLPSLLTFPSHILSSFFLISHRLLL